MSPPASRLTGLVLGALSIAVGIFNWLWIFYAWDAALHMGSPIRKHSEHAVASLTGEHAYVARDSHSTGLVLIDVLGNTFWVMFASGAFLIVIGLFMVHLSWRMRAPQRMAPAAPFHDSSEPGPLHGSA